MTCGCHNYDLSRAFSMYCELLVCLFGPEQEVICSGFLKFAFDIPASVSTPITRLWT